MERIHYLLGILFIVASLLGLYAQTIAYFLHDNFLNLQPFTYLIICTLLSMGIYVGIYVTAFVKVIKNQWTEIVGKVYSFGLFVAVFISFWSFFVLMMWWG